MRGADKGIACRDDRGGDGIHGSGLLAGESIPKQATEDSLGVETTAHVIETGESPFAVSIEVSGHSLVGDEPVAKTARTSVLHLTIWK